MISTDTKFELISMDVNLCLECEKLESVIRKLILSNMYYFEGNAYLNFGIRRIRIDTMAGNESVKEVVSRFVAEIFGVMEMV